jgi:hypothetical protein
MWLRLNLPGPQNGHQILHILIRHEPTKTEAQKAGRSLVAGHWNYCKAEQQVCGFHGVEKHPSSRRSMEKRDWFRNKRKRTYSTKMAGKTRMNCKQEVVRGTKSGSESYVTSDSQSASLSWNKAPIWGLRPDIY